MSKNYYTVREVADLVFGRSISVTTIHHLIDDGTIPAERYGRRKLILGHWVRDRISHAQGSNTIDTHDVGGVAP